MCQNGIVLVLVCTFYYTLGLPVDTTRGAFANDLLNLGDSCENLFLAESIKSRIEYCNIFEPFHSKKAFECLMFYDINNQLCTSFGRMEFDLKVNYTSKMHVAQNVSKICDDAKTWKSETIHYKSHLEKLFSNKLSCLQVCSVDDIVSEDSNFFCKYYKWGAEMISSLAVGISQSSTVTPTNFEIKPNVKPAASATTSNAVNSQRNNLEPQLKDQIQSELPHTKEKNQSEQTTKSETALKQELQKEGDLQDASKTTSVLQKPVIIKNSNENLAPISLSSQSEFQKPIEEPSLKSDLEKENQPKPVIEIPKPNTNLDLEDDPDNELGNDLDPDDEPLLDQDNINDGEDANSDPKIDMDKSKENGNIHKSPITSFNVDIAQKEMVFPNTIQDTFTEDDDHFFPFFLTTIVLVVLLYILYHNKSKVTKVILGLIVEGRQSNRRRNSRGHAYRRLDTLEQAMSTNSTAPPSKIIY